MTIPGDSSIGPTFGGELVLAGLGGLDFSWASDGSFSYGPSITQSQKNQINSVYLAHNPVTSKLLDYSETVRYNTECLTGITIGGVFIQTDLQSQQALHAVYTYCQIHTGITIQWKLPDFTFHSFTAAEISHVFDVTNGFVQSCFNMESTVNGNIKNGTITTNAQIDSQYATIVRVF
jgi:hypothetical protein